VVSVAAPMPLTHRDRGAFASLCVRLLPHPRLAAQLRPRCEAYRANLGCRFLASELPSTTSQGNDRHVPTKAIQINQLTVPRGQAVTIMPKVEMRREAGTATRPPSWPPIRVAPIVLHVAHRLRFPVCGTLVWPFAAEDFGKLDISDACVIVGGGSCHPCQGRLAGPAPKMRLIWHGGDGTPSIRRPLRRLQHLAACWLCESATRDRHLPSRAWHRAAVPCPFAKNRHCDPGFATTVIATGHGCMGHRRPVPGSLAPSLAACRT
jgi:hypothetical protein